MKPCAITLAALAAACCLPGCGPAPEPDEQAVLHYFRQAAIGGKVRRAWPEGQQYIDKVLKRYAALQHELEALEPYRSHTALWHPDDPRWNEAELIRQEVRAMRDVLEDRRDNRAEAYAALRRTLKDVPESLELRGPPRELFVEQALAALELPAEASGLERREAQVRSRLRLFEALLDCPAAREGDAGLVLGEQGCGAEVARLYEACDSGLQDHLDRMIERARDNLYESSRLLATLDRREDRDDFEYHDQRWKAMRERLESIPKALFARIQMLGEELEDLERKEDAPAAAARSRFLTERIEELKAQREIFRNRVSEIIAKAAELKTAETGP